MNNVYDLIKSVLIVVAIFAIGLFAVSFFAPPRSNTERLAAFERAYQRNPSLSSRYARDQAVTVKELLDAGNRISKKSDSECVRAQSSYQCAKNFINQYTVQNTTGLILLNAMAVSAVSQDIKTRSASKEEVLLNMFDLVLTAWEKSDPREFQLSTYQPNSISEAQELGKLKLLEDELLQKQKQETLIVLHKQLTRLHGSISGGRKPSAVQAYSQLVHRYNNLQNKSLRLQ